MENIFIHGLGQTAQSWQKTIDALDAKTNIHCPNLPDIIQNDEVNFPNLYKGFSKYCGNLPGKINICGLSLGSVIALQYAIENPDRINSLTLIAAQYQMPRKTLTIQNLIFQFLPQKMFVSMGFGKKEFIALCKSMMNIDLTDDLKKINCPVLLLCGEKDSANKKASISLSKSLACSKLIFIENSGHEVNVDNPEKLAAIINEFYGKHP